MEIILIIVLTIAVIKLYSRVSKLEKIQQSPNNQTLAQVSPFTPVSYSKAPSPQVVTVPLKQTDTTFVPEKPKKSLEFIVGTRWFTGVGVLLVLLGIGFFFRYAFTHDLISPHLRVLTGLVLGGVFIEIGFWLKKKYRNYGLSLVGVGLGVIYIAFYAAYAFYALVPGLLSFACLIAVVALGIFSAVRYDAEQLAATSLIAGYISVILFVSELSMTGTFVALALMSLILISVSYYKHWPRVASLALIFTTVAVAFWISPSMETDKLLTAFLVGALYLVFALSNLINFAKTEEVYSPWQTFNLYATPIVFFIAEAGILDNVKQIAFLAFGIAAFYAVLTLLVRSTAPTHIALKKFVDVSRLIIPSFVALGIMSYFEGQVAVLTLAVQGLLVVVSGLYFNNRLQYVLGQIIIGVSVILSLGFALDYSGTYPIFVNAPALTFIGVGVALIVSWLSHAYINSEINEDVQKSFRILESLIAYTIFIFVILGEINRNAMPEDLTQLFSVGVSLLALCMFALALVHREKAVRYGTYILFVILVPVVITTAFLDTPGHAFINSNILAMVAVSLLGFCMYKLLQNQKVSAGLESEFLSVRMFPLIGVNLVIFTVITLSVHWYFSLTGNSSVSAGGYTERLSISLFWIIYASAGLVVGIVRRSLFSRKVAAVLFVLATLKILLFDALVLNDLYRFASFITLGTVMLIAGFLYTKFKDRINSFVGISKESKIDPVFPVPK